MCGKEREKKIIIKNQPFKFKKFILAVLGESDSYRVSFLIADFLFRENSSTLFSVSPSVKKYYLQPFKTDSITVIFYANLLLPYRRNRIIINANT